ncbi:MAG: NADH-quinone oxidoreductase subunit A [Polyangiaceae bacterium UTPRO1]|nr:MAG: NADH-quinone oxidoreductase subunit A [Polyangiaceae bacterium UTPRO1]
MLDQYIGVLITFALGTVIVLGMVSGSMIFGARSKGRRAVKDEVFECGNPSSGPARGRFSVHFYLVAILFIVFDVEVVFMYPWAIVFRQLGVPGFIEMLTFVAVLGFGLVYVWRRGALAWD